MQASTSRGCKHLPTEVQINEILWDSSDDSEELYDEDILQKTEDTDSDNDYKNVTEQCSETQYRVEDTDDSKLCPATSYSTQHA